MLHIESATGALRENLLEMGRILNEMTEATVQALENLDNDKVQDIINKDTHVDAIQRSMDRQAAELLALINPLASDFRFVFSVLKMNVDMERIGDHCKNIVKDMQRRESTLAFPEELLRMAHLVQDVVKDTFHALLERKTDLARDILKRDAEIDALELVVINKAGCTVPETMIAMSLERIADHSTNIAENLVYAIEGVDIRELREEYKISAR